MDKRNPHRHRHGTRAGSDPVHHQTIHFDSLQQTWHFLELRLAAILDKLQGEGYCILAEELAQLSHRRRHRSERELTSADFLKGKTRAGYAFCRVRRAEANDLMPPALKTASQSRHGVQVSSGR
ncbi:MAG TPA: hypothetical protein VKD91_04900 [Pyrinomonadaceae bacterium]|nr:hypothetical protein [Pyrinomonadaceae bacterium]